MLVTVANTPLIGLKNLVAPDASMDDGLLDIAVYPDFTRLNCSAILPRQPMKGPPLMEHPTLPGEKDKSEIFPQLDVAAEGIILGKGTARIKVLPGALRVIAPEPGTGAEKPPEKAAGTCLNLFPQFPSNHQFMGTSALVQTFDARCRNRRRGVLCILEFD